MASILTNRGLYKIWQTVLNGTTPPTTFYLALVTSATAPVSTTNTLSDLTEIAAGNGYTSGGAALSRNSTGFPTLTEDDANSRADLTLATTTWTASGAWPSSGAGARYAVLTDDNGTVGSRVVYASFDLSTAYTLTSGQSLSLSGFILRMPTGSTWTNRGNYRRLDYYFRGATPPTTFYCNLVTSATAPTATTNVVSDLTEVANGNGYTTGGQAIARSASGFDSITEDDGNNRARALMVDGAWTATGGSIPVSGNAPRYACLVDDNATASAREVWAAWSLGSDRTATVGQTLRLADFILDANS